MDNDSRGKDILDKLLGKATIPELEVKVEKESVESYATIEITPISAVCKSCGKDYEKNHINEKYCGECKLVKLKSSARVGMRNSRRLRKSMKYIKGKLKKEGNLFCQVCGYKETIDIHHEDDYLFILCPNHHALISRGLQEIKDYDIIPIPI